jgi:hypothetical protein
MDGTVATPAGPEAIESAPEQVQATTGPPCPQCGAPGLARFCESCGYTEQSEAQPGAAVARDEPPDAPVASEEPAAPPLPARWTAVVTASRAQYDAVMAAAGPDAPDVPFPDDCPERTFALTGSQLRIGRRSVSREVEPDIDLTGPPADPGISRMHAILVAQPDGTWTVIDPGSENGTTVNGVEIETGEPVQLHDADTIGIGAWTSIKIVATTN